MNLIGSIEFVDSIQDFGTSPELNGAIDVVTQTVNGRTFVYVSGRVDDGIQVLELAGDGTLTPIMSVADTAALGLNDVGSLSTVQVGSEFFLIASGTFDDALTTFRIDGDGSGTDGYLFHVETYFNSPALGAPNDGAGLLDFPFYQVTTEVGGTNFVIAIGTTSDALSVYRVEANGELTRTDSALDSDDASFRLNGVDSVAVHQVAGQTYVIVGSNVDDGISVFSLSPTGTLANVFNLSFPGLNVGEMQIMDFNGKTFAVFGNQATDRILTYEVMDNGSLAFVSETDQYINGSFSDFEFMESFSVDGVPFFLVAAEDQDTILVMSLDNDGNAVIVQTIYDAVELNDVQDMTVQQMGSRTFIIATSYTNDSVSVFEIGAGNDAIVGTAEDDRIVGMLGDDDLIGRGGDDELIGGRGDDVLSGRRDNDILDGGIGEDVLIGGRGDDILEGGRDADILKGGAGNDTLSYSQSNAGVTVDLVAGTVTGGHGTGDIYLQMESVTGSRFNDLITGDAGRNTLSGLGGNDTIYGGNGKDILLGGDGRDNLWGGGQNDTVRGGGGNDTIRGGSGNDKLLGQGGKDRLIGGSGDDDLTGGGGSDTFVFSNNSGSDDILDFAVGVDKIDLSAIASFQNMADLNAAAFTSGGNTLIFINGGPDSITINGVIESQLSASDFIFV